MKTVLTDRKWNRIAPLLPKHPPQPRGGRPWQSDRACLEGILWVLRSGARWRDLPTELFGVSGVTCWRRLRAWQKAGVWEKLWRRLLGELDRQQRLTWSEAFLDGTFVPAKKGARSSA